MSIYGYCSTGGTFAPKTPVTRRSFMKVGTNTLSVVLRHCMCAGVGEGREGEREGEREGGREGGREGRRERGGKGGRERGKERGKGGREGGREGESCLRQMNTCSHTITYHRLKRSF